MSNEKDFAISELMACLLAREIHDGELVQSGGVRTGVVVAAHRLARLTHAPNATFVSSLAFNTTAPLTRFSTDYEKFAEAERVPVDASESADRFHQGRYDWSALGGLQVDKYGNVNLTCIGDWKRPRLRGPGAAGIPSNIWAKRSYIWMTEHSTRTFVEKVDFITAPGYIDGPGGRERAGLTWGGPALVLSPLGVMDFHPETKRMRLKSVHPGVTVQQIVENTGFELIVPDKVPETSPPTEEELSVLRTKVDPQGILRQVLPYG